MNYWLIVAGLIVVAVAVLAVAMRQAGKAQAAAQVAAGEGSAPAGRDWAPYAVLVLIPMVTLGVYFYLGAPAVLDTLPMHEARSKHDPEAMLKSLEQKLQAEPNDAEGWYTLGRSYLAIEQTGKAVQALKKAVELDDKNARALAQLAEAVAVAQGSLQGVPSQMAEQALEIDPEEEKALELSGLAAYERQEWASAVHFWRRLLKRLPKESEFYQEIEQATKDAEGKAAEASGLGERAKLVAPEKKKNPH